MDGRSGSGSGGRRRGSHSSGGDDGGQDRGDLGEQLLLVLSDLVKDGADGRRLHPHVGRRDRGRPGGVEWREVTHANLHNTSR